jgi:YbgC/YbaW family acyl-CoA thioester hydrolase
MPRQLSCELKVRSYELDAYGHVNHAVFLHYFEQARVEYLEQKNLSFKSLWEEGYVFIIVHAEVDYFEPLTVSDRIEIVGRIEKIGKTSVTILQEMFKSPERILVSRGKFVAVFTDRRTGQPVPIAESFLEAFAPEGESTE